MNGHFTTVEHKLEGGTKINQKKSQTFSDTKSLPPYLPPSSPKSRLSLSSQTSSPPMATSVPSATLSTLSSDHSCSLICSATTKTSLLSKCSSLSSLQLQFPLQLRRQLRIGNSSSRSLRRRCHRLPVVEAKQQTFANFDEVIANSDKPVLVDFYAVWCGPCQFMVPILEKVSDALKDKIQIVKIDTEKYPSIAGQYSIEALPTFILFKDGKPCDRFEGALPADKLIERIETALAVKQ